VFANVELFDFHLKEELLPDEGFLGAPTSTPASHSSLPTTDLRQPTLCASRLDQPADQHGLPSGCSGDRAKYEQMVDADPRDYLMQRGWCSPATKVKFLNGVHQSAG